MTGLTIKKHMIIVAAFHCFGSYSLIAQPVEQVAVNHWVGGSNPSQGAKYQLLSVVQTLNCTILAIFLQKTSLALVFLCLIFLSTTLEALSQLLSLYPLFE